MFERDRVRTAELARSLGTRPAGNASRSGWKWTLSLAFSNNGADGQSQVVLTRRLSGDWRRIADLGRDLRQR